MEASVILKGEGKGLWKEVALLIGLWGRELVKWDDWLDLGVKLSGKGQWRLERALPSSSFVHGQDVVLEGCEGSGRAGKKWEG